MAKAQGVSISKQASNIICETIERLEARNLRKFVAERTQKKGRLVSSKEMRKRLRM